MKAYVLSSGGRDACVCWCINKREKHQGVSLEIRFVIAGKGPAGSEKMQYIKSE